MACRCQRKGARVSGKVFHHACEGRSSAFCGALICNEDATADDHTLSTTHSTSVGCTLTPEDLEDRPPTTAGIGYCRSKESMPTSVGVLVLGLYVSVTVRHDETVVVVGLAVKLAA